MTRQSNESAIVTKDWDAKRNMEKLLERKTRSMK